MSGFSAFVFNLSKSGNILFRSMPNGNCSAQHLATYYAQHFALKSVYGKSQSVIVDKLFSYYRTLFELPQHSFLQGWNPFTFFAGTPFFLKQIKKVPSLSESHPNCIKQFNTKLLRFVLY